LAVTSDDVPPMVTTTAPWLWGASLPVSNVSVLSVPLIGPDTVMASAMVLSLGGPGSSGCLVCVDVTVRQGQFPVGGHPPLAGR
jgi:hypothetical protein